MLPVIIQNKKDPYILFSITEVEDFGALLSDSDFEVTPNATSGESENDKNRRPDLLSKKSRPSTSTAAAEPNALAAVETPARAIDDAPALQTGPRDGSMSLVARDLMSKMKDMKRLYEAAFSRKKLSIELKFYILF